MDLLTNAVQSIQLGVEDYQSNDHARLLSALRNIHAGILLLYKEALRRLSPQESEEVLIKARIVPKLDASGKLIFTGKGPKTADVQQIRERFAGLGIRTDWTLFERINGARNDIEHNFPQINRTALDGVITDSFLLVRSFIANELGGEPQELLGEETWQTLLAVSKVHAEEKAECVKLLESVDWQSEALAEGVMGLRCAQCGSDLLRPEPESPFSEQTEIQCRSCGAAEDAGSFVPRAIEESLSWAQYLSVTDGAETPYVSCPECCEDAYIVDERRCAHCGHEAEHTCQVCGNGIPPEELDSSPYCGWCAHMMAKDD